MNNWLEVDMWFRFREKGFLQIIIAIVVVIAMKLLFWLLAFEALPIC